MSEMLIETPGGNIVLHEATPDIAQITYDETLAPDYAAGEILASTEESGLVDQTWF